jgi:hypothetical protein
MLPIEEHRTVLKRVLNPDGAVSTDSILVAPLTPIGFSLSFIGSKRCGLGWLKLD